MDEMRMHVARYKYAYDKIRAWHVGKGKAALLAVRYAVTGDSGRFRSHGGWRVSHLRIAAPGESPGSSSGYETNDDP